MHADSLVLDYPHATFGPCRLVQADCFEWLARIPEASLHAIESDPPYGVKEFEPDQIDKLRGGSGGSWRVPPSLGGKPRSPLPRFTALTAAERRELRSYFARWGTLAARALKPGGHCVVASNSFLATDVFAAVAEGGLEFRGTISRLVRTLRGGDRPKGAEAEFPGVCTMPRGSHEPWGLFRRPMERGMTVADCLRIHGTGGLRRLPDGRPFPDVIPSGPAPRRERDLTGHPTAKPQALMRALAHALLPLGTGVLASQFAGSGSTVAACLALGLECVGVEREPEYFASASRAIPSLAALTAPSPWPDSGPCVIEKSIEAA